MSFQWIFKSTLSYYNQTLLKICLHGPKIVIIIKIKIKNHLKYNFDKVNNDHITNERESFQYILEIGYKLIN